ncbi:MAG: CpaD family pilus assembly lipoprotein [Rickettsiales bacterium]|nr:CpaD family pilus assembly lipoprotein [Rickettsiales bacterium]
MRRVLIACMVMLAGCDATQDLQGYDPHDYYMKHPVKNTLQTRHADYAIQLNSTPPQLSFEDKMAVRETINTISPPAVDEVVITLSRTNAKEALLKQELTSLIRSSGVDRKITFISTDDVTSREAKLDIRYTAVVPPRCPDWRRSPVTTYSNTMQGNFGCANTVNLGKMVADPHDLIKGSGDIRPDSDATSKTITDYRSGATAAGSGAGVATGAQ